MIHFNKIINLREFSYIFFKESGQGAEKQYILFVMFVNQTSCVSKH